MDLVFKHVDEKDVDMLVMDRASQGGALLDLIVSEVAAEMPGDSCEYELGRVQHSASTRNGESDLVIVMSGPGGDHAILIEDKIDAPPQHEQAERYAIRGGEGTDAGEWSTFSVVLVAPEGYVAADSQPHPHAISYERMLDALPEGDAFGRAMLSAAIGRQAAGWQQVRDETMSAFFDAVAGTARDMKLGAECLHKEGDSRAPSAAWVYFSPPLERTSICWKANQGRVALGFAGWGESVDALKALVGKIPEGSHWRKPARGVGTAFLCFDALYKVEDWESAASDAALIEDALRKVQVLHGFALELNDRAVDWGDAARKQGG